MFVIIFYGAVALLVPIFIYYNRKYNSWCWYTVKSYELGKFGQLKFPCEVTSRCIQSADMVINEKDDPKIFTRKKEPSLPRKRDSCTTILFSLFCRSSHSRGREVVTIACRSLENDIIDTESRIQLVTEIDKLKTLVDDRRSDGSIDVVDQSLNATANGTWISADYNCRKRCFSSPINNIPLLESPALTPLLAQVFAKMLPMFERVLGAPLHSSCSDGPLKVFVKIKIYNVSSENENDHENSFVEGTFHKEGTERENICAVGLYWPHIEGVVGGDIELQMEVPFMHDQYPSRTYYKGQHVVTTSLDVKENSMLVFTNQQVYHRMTRLIQQPINHTYPGQRCVIGFFLVSPWANDVPSSSNPQYPVVTRVLTGSDYILAKERRNRERDIKRGTVDVPLTAFSKFQGRIPSQD